MTWNTRTKVGTDGFGSPVLTPSQNCHECGEALVNPFKSLPSNADTWIWTECEECGEPVCTSCSDQNEHTGERFCISCLHDQ